MSFLLIRPPIPEPLMLDNSASLIRCSSIKARTAGDSRVRPSALSAAAGARAGTSAPLAATTGFDGCDAGALGVAVRVAAVDSSITAISVPTVTVVPSFTLISFSTPGERRGDFGVHLVGDHLDQPLVFLDLVARLLQPFRDGAFGDRLAQLRHFDGRHLPVGSP